MNDFKRHNSLIEDGVPGGVANKSISESSMSSSGGATAAKKPKLKTSLSSVDLGTTGAAGGGGGGQNPVISGGGGKQSSENTMKKTVSVTNFLFLFFSLKVYY